MLAPPPGARAFQLGPGARLVIAQGDLTQWEADAIVNAGEQSKSAKCRMYVNRDRQTNPGQPR